MPPHATPRDPAIAVPDTANASRLQDGDQSWRDSAQRGPRVTRSPRQMISTTLLRNQTDRAPRAHHWEGNEGDVGDLRRAQRSVLGDGTNTKSAAKLLRSSLAHNTLRTPCCAYSTTHPALIGASTILQLQVEHEARTCNNPGERRKTTTVRADDCLLND